MAVLAAGDARRVVSSKVSRPASSRSWEKERPVELGNFVAKDVDGDDDGSEIGEGDGDDGETVNARTSAPTLPISRKGTPESSKSHE
jgi:hypothetical protein